MKTGALSFIVSREYMFVHIALLFREILDGDFAIPKYSFISGLLLSRRKRRSLE